VVTNRPPKPWRRRIRPDDVEPLLGDVVQDQLVDGEHVGTTRESLDEFGCIGASAANDRDLHKNSVLLKKRS